MPNQFPELALFGCGRLPRLGSLALAEARNQLRISTVGFTALEPALCVAFDPARIDEADKVPRLVQKERGGFSVGAGGFQAGVHALCPILA